ncbi:hypothetical protein ACIP0D_004413, partial [Escherichia albertii]
RTPLIKDEQILIRWWRYKLLAFHPTLTKIKCGVAIWSVRLLCCGQGINSRGCGFDSKLQKQYLQHHKIYVNAIVQK